MKTLAMVTNYHHERLIGRKTANFIAAVHAHLRHRGIVLNVEFVLDRPDAATHQQIELAARPLGSDGRIHVVDFGDLGRSRTYGVNAARGNVVCFVDGDDFFSMNWFEGALDYLSGGPRREVIHTQYMVGFDQQEFVRETMVSAHPSFDPLSLAVDWYWNGNLAIQTEVFADMPIQPYDHAGGFGSEDWHWSCNCCAAGIGRASLPGTCYYYRVKPDRFSLGRIGDVIHMASPLFTREQVPAPPAAPSAEPIRVSPLTAEFFAQAREMERFEPGLSYLRSVEAGERKIRHYFPHTPPIVGTVLREALRAGVGSGSTIIFADGQRLAGGLKTAEALCAALTGLPGSPRLYLMDGDGWESHARPDGYVISVGQLKRAGLGVTQIERLVARFFIQFSDITVLNLLSPRARSAALAYSRASRGRVGRWINVVTEYGFDALSQVWDELDAFQVAAVESQNVAVFGKTAREAWRERGARLLYDEGLEADWVDEVLGSRVVSPRFSPDCSAGEVVTSPALARTIRITADGLVAAASEGSGAVTVKVTDRLRALVEHESECIFVLGEAFLGAEFGDGSPPRPPGLRIPALTIIDEEDLPTVYLKQPLEIFERQFAAGGFPADIVAAGAIGFDCVSLRNVLERFPDRFALAALFDETIRRAMAASERCVDVFSPTCIVSVNARDLELIDKGALSRAFRAGRRPGAPR